jgi:hypothetical protein
MKLEIYAAIEEVVKEYGSPEKSVRWDQLVFKLGESVVVVEFWDEDTIWFISYLEGNQHHRPTAEGPAYIEFDYSNKPIAHTYYVHGVEVERPK